MINSRKPQKQPPSSDCNAEYSNINSEKGSKSPFQQFQLRQQLKMLKNVRCEQSSCISLYIPEREKPFEIINYLSSEEASASSIKSSSNRKSVESALSTIKERLKLLPQTQPLKNGLAIFCAEGFTSKRLLVEIYSPPSPVKTFIYKCQATFFVDQLEQMLVVHPCYGFVVSDGSGFLIAKVQGDVEILAEKSETLPNKHNKGGQSSVRFSRLCEATRVRLAKITSQAVVRAFVDNSGMKTQLRGIVICGMSQIKDRVMKELTELCPAIAAKVIGQFDVGYGGRAGLRQGLLLSGEILQSEQHSLERKLISDFLSEFTNDTKQVVFGPEQTIKAIQERNVKKILLFEDSLLQRVSVSHSSDGSIVSSESIQYLTQEEIDRNYHNGKGVFARTNFVEWIVDFVQRMHIEDSSQDPIQIDFISDRTELGHQFAKGFQGIAAFLKFPHDFSLDLSMDGGEFDREQEYTFDEEDDLFI